MAESLQRVPDALRVRARNDPDRIAHDDTARTLRFGEWDVRADAIGGGLASAGVSPGDRVLLAITNRHAVGFAEAFMGVLRAGGICVPLNTRLSPAEVSSYAALVGARFAITDGPRQLRALDLAECWSVDSLPEAPASLPDASTFHPDDPADIIGTSGTTGRQKGVVNTHADLLELIGDATATSPSKSLLHALPFTGFGGCHAVMLLPLRLGSSVYTQPSFDAEGFLALAADRRPDAIQVVPSMLRLLADCPRARDYDLSSVRWIFTGTAPLPPDTLERFTALWPKPRIINVYGMSEGGRGTQTPSRDSVAKPGCVGVPSEPGSVEIRDAHGRPLEDAETGEIWTRVDRPRRYWNDPDATAATWRDGWLRTGDVGHIDADGDLIISGRSKELIIRGGYNIAPIEIEDVLHAHPAVAEAAVVGVSHAVLGEDVAAAVALRPGTSASPDEILGFCRERLADNKLPRVLLVVDALPRNQNAKVVKGELRPALERAAEEQRDRRQASAGNAGSKPQR